MGGISSAARYRPLGRRSLISLPKPGITSSGSGRSEMSSPGNARACMRVRRSPGSTHQTRTLFSSAARTFDACSRAALAAPYPPQPVYAPAAASEVMLRTAPPRRRSEGRSAWR